MYMEKVRIYPTKKQRETIDKILWECKCLYNDLIAIHEKAWNDDKKTLTKFDMCKKIKELPKLSYTPAQVQQNVATRVDDAYKRFFRKTHGHPKFKSINGYRSFTYPQMNNRTCTIHFDSNKIMFGRIGYIKTKFTRKLRGRPKTCSLKKMGTGKYYAFIAIDDSCENPVFFRKFGYKRSVGIDLGIEKFITTSDGKFLPRPEFSKKYRVRLSRAHRKLSRMKTGSNNQRKFKKKLSRLYEKISNMRCDYHYKVIHWLVTHYTTIIIEDLHMSFMINKVRRKSKTMAILAHELAFGEFILKLEHMSKKYHCKLIKVDPRNTSQRCSYCGKLVPKDLKTRTHCCSFCGVKIDRDLNAAINILSLGIPNHSTVGTTGKYKLVEIRSSNI